MLGMGKEVVTNLELRNKFVHDCIQAVEENLRRNMLRQKTKVTKYNMVGKLVPMTQSYWIYIIHNYTERYGFFCIYILLLNKLTVIILINNLIHTMVWATLTRTEKGT